MLFWTRAGEWVGPMFVDFLSPYHRVIAEAVQQMWRQNLGVIVALRN
jgi:hypothetical protein